MAGTSAARGESCASSSTWTSARRTAGAREEVVPAREILATIGARWPLEPLAPTRAGEVAARYRYADGAGEIGFISSISAPFCGGCTRARLSADGMLFTCLFASAGMTCAR